MGEYLDDLVEILVVLQRGSPIHAEYGPQEAAWTSRLDLIRWTAHAFVLMTSQELNLSSCSPSNQPALNLEGAMSSRKSRTL